MKKLFLGIVIFLVVLGVGAVSYYAGSLKSRDSVGVPNTPEPVVCTLDAKECPDGSFVGRVPPNCEFAPCPTLESQPGEPTPKDEWRKYDNSEYGFSIYYPETYQVLTDPENLYGWPNALVLFYKGGQSYDLVVQVWDSETEYKATYPASLNNYVVKKVGDKYITLLNQNSDPEVDEIIATFLLSG